LVLCVGCDKGWGGWWGGCCRRCHRSDDGYEKCVAHNQAFNKKTIAVQRAGISQRGKEGKKREESEKTLPFAWASFSSNSYIYNGMISSGERPIRKGEQMEKKKKKDTTEHARGCKFRERAAAESSCSTGDSNSTLREKRAATSQATAISRLGKAMGSSRRSNRQVKHIKPRSRRFKGGRKGWSELYNRRFFEGGFRKGGENRDRKSKGEKKKGVSVGLR